MVVPVATQESRADEAALHGISLTWPGIGEHTLRVLVPDVLELVRINGLPPGGPVDG